MVDWNQQSPSLQDRSGGVIAYTRAENEARLILSVCDT